MIPLLLGILEPLFIIIARFGMFVFFGFAAAGTWLFQFVRLDKLPEPAKMVAKIFFLGIVITIPVFFVELGFAYSLSYLPMPHFFAQVFYWFIAIALVEETFKFLVVKSAVLKSYEFDEPVDAMVYMIISAMGFAALENVLYLLPVAGKVLSFDVLFISTATIAFFRFVGATFLHALCSGLIGYFLAISLCKKKNHTIMILSGLVLATFLHGLYNFSIMELKGSLIIGGLNLGNIQIVIPASILIGLAIFVFIAISHLKKLKSVCRI